MTRRLLLFALCVLALASCEQDTEEKGYGISSVTSFNMLSGATFRQYAAVTDDDGNTVDYVEADDGNYIEFSIPMVANLHIFTLNADGTEHPLIDAATGSTAFGSIGMFSLLLPRGSSPQQRVYFRHASLLGLSVTAFRDFTVSVPPDIAPELQLLCSPYDGEKAWVWDSSVTGAVWGTMGYCGGAGSDVGLTGKAQWWGVSTEEQFMEQLRYTPDNTYHGDGSLQAQMIFSEDGTVRCLDAEGRLIRQGTFAVEQFNDSDPQAWRMGYLRTDDILWPWVVGTKGMLPSQVEWGSRAYEIVHLSADRLTLVYPGREASGHLGSWGEATFWHFRAK